MSSNTELIPTTQYDEVVRTGETYIDGLRHGDPNTLRKAFHPDATMYGLTTQGDLLGGRISNLYDFVQQHDKAPEVKTRVDIIGIMPTIAVAKVDMEKDAAGFDYTDSHTLIKLDGKWSIIAKTFHTYA